MYEKMLLSLGHDGIAERTKDRAVEEQSLHSLVASVESGTRSSGRRVRQSTHLHALTVPSGSVSPEAMFHVSRGSCLGLANRVVKPLCSMCPHVLQSVNRLQISIPREKGTATAVPPRPPHRWGKELIQFGVLTTNAAPIISRRVNIFGCFSRNCIICRLFVERHIAVHLSKKVCH